MRAILLRFVWITESARWWLGASPWIRTLTVVVFVILPAVASGQQVGDPTEATTIKEWAQLVFQLGIVLIVLAAAIFIAIGAFMYLAASGDASMAQAGKEYITRAIMGLVLGLITWIILNTIQPQFTRLDDPSLGGGG